jgi:hypothetical protein|tara:strand:+ start:199 stop:408 length:210 start_codon:yes stop_codon:yes gene_type:complete
VGKENKIKMGTFQDLNFNDVFDAMDVEYLEEIAYHDPKQLRRMCIYLTLDNQIRKEGLTKSHDKDILMA